MIEQELAFLLISLLDIFFILSLIILFVLFIFLLLFGFFLLLLSFFLLLLSQLLLGDFIFIFLKILKNRGFLFDKSLLLVFGKTLLFKSGLIQDQVRHDFMDYCHRGIDQYFLFDLDIIHLTIYN